MIAHRTTVYAPVCYPNGLKAPYLERTRALLGDCTSWRAIGTWQGHPEAVHVVQHLSFQAQDPEQTAEALRKVWDWDTPPDQREQTILVTRDQVVVGTA